MNIEALESRIAPATLVNPTTVTYTDVDGDDVTVKITKGTFDLASNFLFIDTDPSPAVREQLQRITVSSIGFEGASLTITAKRNAQNGGDGLANVGHIVASFRHVGAVSVDGDIGQIDVGDSTGVALKSLTVQSMGRFGVSTQEAGGELDSGISGQFGVLSVKGDIVGASIQVLVGGAGIGSVKIGGSLFGAGDSEGQIAAGGVIGKVQIGGDLQGGGGSNSGAIIAETINAITIGGSLIGGAGASNSGQIRATTGDIGLVKIGGNMLGGSGQLAGSIVAFSGNIAGVTVGGSLIGASGVDGASIYAGTGLGPVKIGHDVRGSTLIRSAVIDSNAAFASVTIGGSLIGGAQNAGVIAADGALGPVTIGGSVKGGNGQGSGTIFGNGIGLVKIAGDLLGGGGVGAGAIFTSGQLAGVAIGGSVVGGSGPHVSGQIHAALDIGPITIGGDLRGEGADTGNIRGDANIGAVTIGGSIIGGADNSGRIVRIFDTGNVGPVVVKGDLIGGAGLDSGQIVVQNGDLASVKIGGSLLGGSAARTGMVSNNTGKIGPVTIGGDMAGSSGGQSGTVSADGIGAVSVTGALRGGGGSISGVIRSDAGIGAVKIGGDVAGGTSVDSGQIVTFAGPIASVTIGGDLIGGFFNRTGEVFATGDIGPVKIGGDIRGGSAFGVLSLDRSGYIQGEDIKSVTVGGSIVSGVWDGPPGTLTKSGSIRAEDALGPVVVKGSLDGNGSAPVLITARGQNTAGATLAIKSLSVGDRVEFAQILAGCNPELAFQNTNAQIGAVTVGGDWIASSAAAAVLGVNGMFGDADDTPLGIDGDAIFSKIASITIKGQALGTVGGADHFGFVAQQIGSLSVAGTKLPLRAGAGNDLPPDDFAVGATGDLRVREVAI